MIVETSRKDGKDLSKYVQIKQIIEDILHGRRSPLGRIPMSGQRKAVKGLMAKKRDGKVMAASRKKNEHSEVGGAHVRGSYKF